MMEGATSKNRAPVKSTSIRGNIDHVYGNSYDFFLLISVIVSIEFQLFNCETRRKSLNLRTENN